MFNLDSPAVASAVDIPPASLPRPRRPGRLAAALNPDPDVPLPRLPDWSDCPPSRPRRPPAAPARPGVRVSQAATQPQRNARVPIRTLALGSKRQPHALHLQDIATLQLRRNNPASERHAEITPFGTAQLAVFRPRPRFSRKQPHKPARTPFVYASIVNHPRPPPTAPHITLAALFLLCTAPALASDPRLPARDNSASPPPHRPPRQPRHPHAVFAPTAGLYIFTSRRRSTSGSCSATSGPKSSAASPPSPPYASSSSGASPARNRPALPPLQLLPRGLASTRCPSAATPPPTRAGRTLRRRIPPFAIPCARSSAPRRSWAISTPRELVRASLKWWSRDLHPWATSHGLKAQPVAAPVQKSRLRSGHR